MERYDVVGMLSAFEYGELDDAETLGLFAYLVQSGLAWSLQGSYGRVAAALIDNGYLSRDGSILKGTE